MTVLENPQKTRTSIQCYGVAMTDHNDKENETTAGSLSLYAIFQPPACMVGSSGRQEASSESLNLNQHAIITFFSLLEKHLQLIEHDIALIVHDYGTDGA